MGARAVNPAGARYPLRPWVERAWRGEGGWGSAFLLRPLELLYRAGSAVARFRAARGRRPVAGLTVIAIGGLTTGGAGKTTLARWAARAALQGGRRPAILLRGHGAEAASGAPQVVPGGAPGDPVSARRFGDEAIAHRAGLPPSILVVTGKDRRRAAGLAAQHGADLAILDDGWEQGTLCWDHLWVVVDAVRPLGNGRLLPAGPLRRRPDNLSQANVIVEIDEMGGEGSAPAKSIADRPGNGPPIVRFLRRVESWHRVGAAPETTAAAPAPPRGRPVLLLSSVGAPDRLERFLRAAGFPPDEHMAIVEAAVAALRTQSGAAPVVMVTDKDLARAALLPNHEVWVVRSEFEPVGDPAPLLAAFQAEPERAPVAARPPMG